MSVLGLIPARGGSKGIPKKNIRPIASKPLIAWTIEAALGARLLDRVVVTTDNAEIAEVACAHGAEIPFLRPVELARDETPGIEPVLHALDQLGDYNIVVLLQPTSPLRTSDDIDAAIRLAMERNASVVSVTDAAHAGWTFPMNSKNILDLSNCELVARRQDLPSQWALNGAVYVAAAQRLRSSRTFLTPGTVGYRMPIERSVDIDDELDWRIAEMLLSERS